MGSEMCIRDSIHDNDFVFDHRVVLVQMKVTAYLDGIFNILVQMRNRHARRETVLWESTKVIDAAVGQRHLLFVMLVLKVFVLLKRMRVEGCPLETRPFQLFIFSINNADDQRSSCFVNQDTVSFIDKDKI